MKKVLLTLSVVLCIYNMYAQIRPATIVKPTSQNALVSIKQRNLEIEQQAFANRSNKDEAWFYENANYGGRKFVLERGSYSLKELGADLNDFLSSAIIPANLIVVCYANDNFDGDWFILKPDNTGNLNFEKAVATKAKVGGRLISGKVVINDAISSIVIYNPEQDYVSLSGLTIFEIPSPDNVNNYTDIGNYDSAKFYRAFPAPYINGIDGHNMDFLGLLNDKISIIILNNSRLDIQIHQDAGFKGYQCLIKKITRHYENHNNSYRDTDVQDLYWISLTDCGTITATIGSDRAWANRVSSFKVNIAPGHITEITK